MKKRNGEIRVSEKFVIALAFVSIVGFLGIVSQTIIGYDISMYVEAIWMLTIGVGFIIEAQIKKLKSLRRGLTSNNFSHLTTIIIGLIAIIAGIFSFPFLRFMNPAFVAIKGIVSLVAVIVIIIQIWVNE